MQDCRCEHCGKVVAELVRLRTQRKASEAGQKALQKAKRFSRVFGPLPFGKRLAEDGVTLIDDPKEQTTIHVILKLRASGEGYHAIADALNTRGLKTKRGGKWFAKQARDVVVRAG